MRVLGGKWRKIIWDAPEDEALGCGEAAFPRGEARCYSGAEWCDRLWRDESLRGDDRGKDVAGLQPSDSGGPQTWAFGRG